MEDVDAADRFYRGMAQAAFDRNITIQYCLPSATDMLVRGWIRLCLFGGEPCKQC